MPVTVLSMVISVDYTRLKGGYKAKRFYCLSRYSGGKQFKVGVAASGRGGPRISVSRGSAIPGEVPLFHVVC